MNKTIRLLLYTTVFLLVLFDLLYLILLLRLELLPENAHKVVLVAIVAMMLLLIAKVAGHRK